MLVLGDFLRLLQAHGISCLSSPCRDNLNGKEVGVLGSSAWALPEAAAMNKARRNIEHSLENEVFNGASRAGSVNRNAIIA